jgi:hypothetical protein
MTAMRTTAPAGVPAKAFPDAQRRPTWLEDAGPSARPVQLSLTAAIVAVIKDEPMVRVVADAVEPGNRLSGLDCLPHGEFEPEKHSTLESALRACAHQQTGLDVGYLEQLYTFADGTTEGSAPKEAHISIGYLALTHPNGDATDGVSRWSSCYSYFPWEDWRRNKPQVLTDVIEPRLIEWANTQATASSPHQTLTRHDRLRIYFGMDGGSWDEERVLERYEVMRAAGLLETALPNSVTSTNTGDPAFGHGLAHDHRRVLATALGRLRAKIKYRPVIFELMGDDFTLFELQRTVEAILGPHLHKQNFRRLVESMGLVEPTGEVKTHTGGRPAKLFRFRRNVLLERPAPGVRVRMNGGRSN